MNSHANRCRAIAQVAASVLCLGGLGIIAGWQFGISLLRGALFHTYVAPNTALLFIVAGIAILAQSAQRRGLRLAGSLLGIPIFLFAFATLLQYLLHLDFGIDALFMRNHLSDWHVSAYPGRFSSTTATTFCFAGLSLATLRLNRKTPFSDILAGAVALLAYLGAIGYIYNARLLYGQVTAIHTIALFVVLAVALWCSSNNLAFVDLVSSRFAGGFVARRVTLAILVLLPILGWVEIRGREYGLVSRELGIALLVAIAASIITGLVLHTASVLNEVDRRRTQAESILIRTEKLATAGRMAATIAHEINNPLAAITNLVYLSRVPGVDPGARDYYLSKADEELGRVAMIAKKTLGFYRESSAPSEVDPVKIVSDVVDIYSNRFSNKGITVEQEFRCSKKVFCSPGELRQVLANLIANAIDACPEVDGYVRVTVIGDGEGVRMAISDNGRGVTPEHQARIFDAFFTTKKDFGTGLGLWVSKQLIEKNGGLISLETNTGSYTTFAVHMKAHSSRSVPADEQTLQRQP